MANRMRRLVIAGALVWAACGIGAVHAAAALSVTIEPAGEPDEFVVTTSIRDLSSDQLVAAPRVVVAAGRRAEAVIEAAADGATRARLEVAVDSTATRATWRLEWHREGRLEAVSDGSVTLAGAEDRAY